MSINFEQYQKTLYNQAWNAHLRCQAIPIDDFISEGHEIFMKCAGKYNKARPTKFNSYYTTSLVRYFKGMVANKIEEMKRDVCTRETVALKGVQNQEIDGSEHVWKIELDHQGTGFRNEVDPERQVIFKETLNGLPDDARFVVNLILESPTEFINSVPHLNLLEIRNYLRKRWHGTEIQDRISKAFTDIREALKTL